MDNIKDLARYISLANIPSSWLNCYEDIKKEYDSAWLYAYDFDLILSYYNFDSTFQKRFKEELELLNKDHKLNMICFIMYYILFKADNKDYYDIWSWKSTENIFKNHGSYMLCVIALLCGHDLHSKNMQERIFSEEQIKLQKDNILLTCTSDQKKIILME